jgi:hypothetical protein
MKYITIKTPVDGINLDTKVIFVSHIVSVETAILKFGTDQISFISTDDGKTIKSYHPVEEIMEMINNANS